MAPGTHEAALARLRELLEFRLPHSGKPLGTIVLSREHAEALLELIAKRVDQAPRNGL